MQQATLRIGLLGASRIAPRAVIDPARVIAGVEVVAVAARDRERGRAWAEQHGIPGVCEDYAALVADDDVDLVYNALPVDQHARWSIAALGAGKHVLCEKPFAMHTGEAEVMVETARSRGRRLVEAIHTRYHPAFETLLAWTRAGEIGSIEHIDSYFNVSIPFRDGEIRHYPRHGGGAMMDLGCYPLHWALALCDGAPEVTSARASLTALGVDESLQATLCFPGGASAEIATSMAPGTPFEARLTVHGTDGRIDFENPLAPHANGRLTLRNTRGRREAPISPISTYTWQIAALLAALRSSTALPTEGKETLRQQRALDAVYHAAGLTHLRTAAP